MAFGMVEGCSVCQGCGGERTQPQGWEGDPGAIYLHTQECAAKQRFGFGYLERELVIPSETLQSTDSKALLGSHASISPTIPSSAALETHQ